MCGRLVLLRLAAIVVEMVRCEHRNLRPVVDAELAHDLADVDLHGGFRDAELASDDLVGRTLGKYLEDALLTIGHLRHPELAVCIVVIIERWRLFRLEPIAQ